MTREDVIRMAKEAGAEVLPNSVMYFQAADLERFAALVAAAEREACAEIRPQDIKGGVLASDSPRKVWMKYRETIRARGTE